MDATDRKDFEARLAQLFGAIDRPLGDSKTEGFWKGLQRMTLVQFNRACDQVLRELEDGEPPRTFTVGHLWAAYRRTRALGPTHREQQQPAWQGDSWDERANLRLYMHIRNQAARGVHYCCPRTRIGLHKATDEPTAETRQLTAILVSWKNAWARDCRESSPPPDAATLDRWWVDIMARAEVEVAQARLQYASAA